MTSKIILGTVQFGLDYGVNNKSGKPPKEEVFGILKLARENGITTLDTADHYGNSAALIGEYSATSSDRFLINTKFKADKDTTISVQLVRSLEQLKVDFINVYFYHSYQDLFQYPRIKTELSRLKHESKIKNIGVSIYSNEELEKVATIEEVDVIQIPFNLLDNISQRGRSIKKAKDNGKRIQARSLFLQGLFFKELASYPAYLVPLKKYVEKLLDIRDRSGLSMENICLSYALNQPDIDEVIIGVDNAQQLTTNLSYSKSLLAEHLVREIDSIAVKETELLYPTNWK